MQSRLVSLLPLAVLLGLAMLVSSCGRSGEPSSTAPPSLTSISVASGDTRGPVYPGLTQRFSAKGVFADGSTADVTSLVAWTSSDREVATITAGGLATGLNPGSTNITAILNGISSQPVRLDVEGFAMVEQFPYWMPNMTIGATVQLQARIMKDNGDYDYIFADGWTSSDNSVAPVASNGLVTALKPGTAYINLIYKGFKSRPSPVTVVDFVSLTVSPQSPENLKSGSTLQFTATIDYPDGKSEDITATAGWKSTNLQVGVFRSPGILTGDTPGFTVIQAQWQGVWSAPVTLFVVN